MYSLMHFGFFFDVPCLGAVCSYYCVEIWYLIYQSFFQNNLRTSTSCSHWKWPVLSEAPSDSGDLMSMKCFLLSSSDDFLQLPFLLLSSLFHMQRQFWRSGISCGLIQRQHKYRHLVMPSYLNDHTILFIDDGIFCHPVQVIKRPVKST